MQNGMSEHYYSNVFSVRQKLTDAEILAQLAEEAAELAQAALKYRRCLDKTNPTPIPNQEAHDRLCEELADVLVCVDALDGDPDCETVRTIREKKAQRWAARLDRLPQRE